MNRKHGQSQRPGQSQSSMKGSRSGQSFQNGRNSNHDMDTEFEMSSSREQREYRDTDYDLDGSTYGSRSSANLGGRSTSAFSSDSAYGGEMGDYDTNERIRPSRSSTDEDRFSSNRSSYDSSLGRYAGSQGDRGLSRQASSSERFGYPSNMNAWSGSMDRSSERTEWGASQRGHFGKGPKGYKRSDDRIKEEVCETLARHPSIDASEIEVEVSDSMVTLSGTVESKDIRRAAEMAIENLSGVDDVKNEIRVKKADSFSSSIDSTFASSTASKNSKMNKGSNHIS